MDRAGPQCTIQKLLSQQKSRLVYCLMLVTGSNQGVLGRSGPVLQPKGRNTETYGMLSAGVATTRENIAAYTAKAAVDPHTLNKRLIIRPPENIVSQNELISLWERISGNQVRRCHMSEEELQKNIEGLLISSHHLKPVQ